MKFYLKLREEMDNSRMNIKALLLVFPVLLIAGCAAPTYEDGSPREYSDMPWSTPASWEGSVGIPGVGGYD
jgi:hypothetical protein